MSTIKTSFLSSGIEHFHPKPIKSNPCYIKPSQICFLPPRNPHRLPFESFQQSRHKTVSLKLSPSKIQHFTSDFTPRKSFAKFLSENVVVFLVGSFIFLGSFNAKPSLAVQHKIDSSSAKLEENRDTQKKGESENDEMYEELLKKEPRNVDALKVVLYGKMRKGETKEAVKYVEKLIGIEPNEVEWKLLRALCYDMMGELSKAKSLFREILTEYPLLLRALHGLAMVMHKGHEGPAVFVMLNKALEVASREKRVTEERSIKILIAQMHLVKGNLEDGLRMFQDLVDQNPGDFRPYLCQGIIYSLLDKKEEAEKHFEMYRSLVPDEFAQRGFLDDVLLAAKTKPQETT